MTPSPEERIQELERIVKEKSLIIAKMGRALKHVYDKLSYDVDTLEILEEALTPDILATLTARLQSVSAERGELIDKKHEHGLEDWEAKHLDHLNNLFREYNAFAVLVKADSDLRKSLEALERALKETGNSPDLAYKLFDMAKALEEKEAEIARLRGERCYICRPDDPMAAQEGCSDCDGRSDDFHTIDTLRTQVEGLGEALERHIADSWGCGSRYKDSLKQAKEALAKFYKKEKE